MNLYHIELPGAQRPRCDYIRGYVVAAESELEALFSNGIRLGIYEYIMGLVYDQEVNLSLVEEMHRRCMPLTFDEARHMNVKLQPVTSVKLMSTNVVGYVAPTVICVDYHQG